MSGQKPPEKLADSLPPRPPPTTLEFQQLEAQAARARAEMSARTAPMLVLDSEDLRIRLR
ncbi:MAG: hypothetical protein HC927_00515 [Deltaproteobacteria bacterium]|nr:hypothetical protein [Deltaproteobacteria bacterium]